MIPPTIAAVVGTSPKASHTQTGPRGVSRTLTRAVSVAGIRRDPMVRSKKARPV
jgi:hypothetical protein